jgi:hypothetical protein
VRTSLNLGRLLVRVSRQAVRTRRSPERWWSTSLGSATGIRLVPAAVEYAVAWHALVTTVGARPPAEGIAASSLGGGGGGTAEWIKRCVRLRASARRGAAFPYLVEVEGTLAGEALAFVDDGTSAAELVVWLAPGFTSTARLADTIELLTLHLFAGPTPPGRALVSVAIGEQAVIGAVTALGFVVEGEVRDPPRPSRALLVAHRSAAANAPTPG